MIILIPAYEPDERLVDLVEALAGEHLVVVDDGSGPKYRHLFAAVAARGAEVLVHAANRGKGAALRTGFSHVQQRWPGESVVCADSDGQHRPTDIIRVATAVEALDDHAAMVLGVRRFAGAVPRRSRFGNATTRWLFATVSGVTVSDTQTGLRGYPAGLLDWLLDIPGDRFEYEQRLLLRAASERVEILEVVIDTVYLAGNSSSHFRPVRDSWRIWRPLLAAGIRSLVHRDGSTALRFGASSFLGFLLDLSVFTALVAVGQPVLPAVVLARLLSGTTNFLVNRHWVFRGHARPPLLPAALRYAGLAAVPVGGNALLLPILLATGLPAAAAKTMCEAVLFAASFLVQHRFAGRSVRRAESRAQGLALRPRLTGRPTGTGAACHRRGVVRRAAG